MSGRVLCVQSPDERHADRRGWRRLRARLTTSHTHHVSLCLTTLAPQPRHRPAKAVRFSWSQGFDHIFRKEEVGGSNPVSSTERPGQGDFREYETLAVCTVLPPGAPQPCHRIERFEHLAGSEVLMVIGLLVRA